jgi:hypothetical protein
MAARSAGVRDYPMQLRQKRPTILTKETHYSDKRDPLTKETHYSVRGYPMQLCTCSFSLSLSLSPWRGVVLTDLQSSI